MCACAAACGGCLVFCGDEVCLTPLGAGAHEQGFGRGCVRVPLLGVGVEF